MATRTFAESPASLADTLLLRQAAMLLKLSDSVLHTAAAFYYRYILAAEPSLAAAPASSRTADAQATAPKAAMNADGAAAAAVDSQQVTDATRRRAAASSSDSPPEDREHLPAACLFLASKVNEEPRRIRDVINMVHQARSREVLTDSKLYWRLKEGMVRQEQQLLRALGFDTTVQHVQPLLFNLLRTLCAPPDMCRISNAIVNDAALLNLQLPTVLTAAAAAAVAAILAHIALPHGWWCALELREIELADACHRVLDMYQAHCVALRSGGCAPAHSSDSSNSLQQERRHGEA